MSVRAYRVIEIKINPEANFNLWHDQEILDWLRVEADVSDETNTDGCGMMEFSVKDMRRMLKALPHLDPLIVRAIKDDIKAVRKAGEEYIKYECY